MPNLIDKPQLQATAQVAKSYILDQDTANIGTIINALQQSSNSTPDAKIEDAITVTVDGVEVTGSTLPLSQAGGAWIVNVNSHRSSATFGYVGRLTGAVMTEIAAIYRYNSSSSFVLPDGSGTAYTLQVGNCFFFLTMAKDNYTAAVKLIKITEG